MLNLEKGIQWITIKTKPTNPVGHSLQAFLNSKKEKVKMLTADGKLVEVDKAVLDAAGKQKVNNKEILQWMNNPSKNENEI
jgi:hypothetical protein